MKSFILAAVVAMAGTALAHCDAGNSDNGLLIGPTNDPTGCLCPSGEFWDADNVECATNTCGTPASPTDNEFSSSGMSLTTVDMAGNDSDVTLGVIVPAAASRIYDDIVVLGPDVGDTELVGCDSTVFKNAIAVDGLTINNGDCVDKLNLIATFAALRGCGFQLSATQVSGDTYESWDGVIRVKYHETVVIGDGGFQQNMRRDATVDFPFRLNFKSQETFAVTVDNVTVYAQQQIDFAITDMIIPKDGSEPTATLAFTIQYPYAITHWLDYDVNPTQTNDVDAELGHSNVITATMVGGPTMCRVPGDYSNSGTAATATCKKDGHQIQFSKNGECSFDGDEFTLDFQVQCSSDIAAPDCPLQAVDNSGNVTFTLTSENFCISGVATNNMINNVITLNEFYAAQLSNWSAIQTAWRLDDRAFFVIKTLGLPLKSLAITKLERQFAVSNSGDLDPQTGSWERVAGPVGAPTDASPALDNTDIVGFFQTGAMPALATGQVSTTTPAGVLGLVGAEPTYLASTNSQEFHFSALMNSALLGSGYSSVIRGRASYFILRATVDVSYDTSRRRRRQTSSTGTGSVSSDTQSVTAPESTAEAAPSSASRTAPVLALALAILSAVLMA